MSIKAYWKGGLCFRVKHFSITFLAALPGEVTRVPAVSVLGGGNQGH